MLWWETTSDKSFGSTDPENGTAISTWYDINPTSTYKINATQNTSANQPVYTTNCANMLPCLRFTNANSSYFSYDGSFLIGTDYTVIVVEQRRTTTSGNYFLSGNSATTNGNLVLGYRTNFRVTFAQYNNDADLIVTGYSSPIPWIHVFKLSSTSGKTYYLNGATDTTGSAQTQQLVSYASPYVGRSNVTNFYYEGDLCEIIMFSRAITNEERDSIEEYLGKKWRIRVL